MRQIALVLFLFAAGTLSVGYTQISNSTQPESGSDETKSEPKVALISITSDPTTDFQNVNMALIFAGFCVDEGYDANIFLNVKGVKLATEKFSKELNFNDHPPLKTQLVSLAKRGLQIHVCPVCMKDFEITSEEIIPEAFVTDKKKLFAKLGANTMVFSY